MIANDLSQFSFRIVSSGTFRVTYRSRNRGDYYSALINDMHLIDATYNSESARVKDLERLRHVVIRDGYHFRHDGTRLS